MKPISARPFPERRALPASPEPSWLPEVAIAISPSTATRRSHTTATRAPARYGRCHRSALSRSRRNDRRNVPHGTFSPRYDLAAQVHSSDVGTLMAAVQPRAAALVAGSVDADLALRGTGMRPRFTGTIDAPEGSVNGLAFRDLHAAVSGDIGALSVAGGRVVVGSSLISVAGSASPESADVAIDAPRLDLADFNDFFDTGDTFAGTGSLALRARTRWAAASQRPAAMRTSRTRDFAASISATSRARWTSAGGSILARCGSADRAGVVTLAGSVAPEQKQVALTATATRLDLSTWLPMLGLNAPITGRLNAQTSLSGTYPDIAMRLRAAVYGGTAGPLPIERFEIVASASNGRGRIESAILDVPSLSNVASGTFGLRPNDPIALTLSSRSANVGDFFNLASGKQFPIRGSFASTLRVEGTPLQPRLRDSVVLETLQYRNLTIARIAGEIDADRRSVALRNGEVDLEHGKALISGEMPVTLTQSGIHPGNGPISGALLADDVELSNFAPLLPKGIAAQRTHRWTARCYGNAARPESRRFTNSARRHVQRTDRKIADYRDRRRRSLRRRSRAAAIACVRRRRRGHRVGVGFDRRFEPARNRNVYR